MSLRGSGGELLRGAVTNYIQNMSDAHFPCHNDNIVDLWKMVLGEDPLSPDWANFLKFLAKIAQIFSNNFGQIALFTLN